LDDIGAKSINRIFDRFRVTRCGKTVGISPG